MGKKTLYHPISTHVIRGAAEYCGWQFGKLTQDKVDRELTTASYTCEINGMPHGTHNWSYPKMFRHLSGCFTKEMKITNLWRTRAGQWMCELEIDLRQGDVDPEDIAALANDVPF